MARDGYLGRIGPVPQICGGTGPFSLTCDPLGTDTEAGAIHLSNLALKRFQFLPQHVRKPVLFEREGLRRPGFDWQLRGSDGSGRHTCHDAQPALRLEGSTSPTLCRAAVTVSSRV